MDDAADIVWRALADPTRRAILDLLRAGPRTTGALVDAFPTLTRFGVMKHIASLVDADLIVSHKQGRTRWNHLNAVPLRRIYERWVSRYEDHWAGSLTRLQRAAERQSPEPPMPAKLLDRPARIAVIDMAIDINAPRERVWHAFINETASWFYESPDTKDSRPTILEPRLGGKMFIQTAGTQDENLLAIVTCIKPPRELRLRGDFTIPQAFVANVTITFEETAQGTRITLTHRMAGDFDDDLPAGFDEGWMDGLVKLKALVEP